MDRDFLSGTTVNEVATKHNINPKTVQNIIMNSNCTINRVDKMMNNWFGKMVVKLYDTFMVNPTDWMFKKLGRTYRPYDYRRK